MPDIGYHDSSVTAPLKQVLQPHISVLPQRALLVVIVTAAGIAGFLATSPEAASQAAGQAGVDLTRLLRAMAGIKAIVAVGLAALVLWRLAMPIGRARFVMYALSCATMAAGPGLIWGMTHVKLGALLLHGGAFVTAAMLCRDPGMGMRLEAEIACRRARLRPLARHTAREH